MRADRLARRMIGARALIGAIAGILGGPWTIAGLIGVRLDQPPPGALIAARATIAVKDPDLREAAASSSGPRRVEHCPPIWGPAAAPAASSQGAATPPPPPWVAAVIIGVVTSATFQGMPFGIRKGAFNEPYSSPLG